MKLPVHTYYSMPEYRSSEDGKSTRRHFPQLHAHRREGSIYTRDDNQKFYGAFSSLGNRFRRSKSLSTVNTVSETPNQNPRERRRRSREASIFSDSSVFKPNTTHSSYRPNLIAIAGVMIATGELDRLSFRANKIAKARAANRSDASSPGLTPSPSGLPNTPVSMSGSPGQQGLKFTKGSFPTFVPTNTPISGSRTPAEISSPPDFSRRGSRVGPSHLSEVHVQANMPREMAKKDCLSTPRLDLSLLRSGEQREDLTTDSINGAPDMVKDKGAAESGVSTVCPSSPVHSPSAHYFTPVNFGMGPARNMKLRDHSSCESFPTETNYEPISRQSSPNQTAKSPVSSPFAPPFENTEEYTPWKPASKLYLGLSSPSDASQTVASNQNEERATEPPTPGGLLEPRESWTNGFIRALGDIHGLLNEKPPPSS